MLVIGSGSFQGHVVRAAAALAAAPALLLLLRGVVASSRSEPAVSSQELAEQLSALAPSPASASSSFLPGSIGRARAILKLAYAAYCPSIELASWTCYWCTVEGISGVRRLYEPTTRTPFFVAVSEATAEIYVAFSGSVGMGDSATAEAHEEVFYNLSLTHLAHPLVAGAAIHSGWLRQWGLVQPLLCVALRVTRVGRPLHTLVLTGHSTGASLATVAAYMLSARVPRADRWPPERVSVINFGASMVGNAEFADEYERIGLGRRTFRFTHGADAAPRQLGWLPAPFNTSARFAYFHLGTEIWEDSSLQWTRCRGFAALQKELRAVRPRDDNASRSGASATSGRSRASARARGADPDCSVSLGRGKVVRDHHRYLGLDAIDGHYWGNCTQ
jgi:hypothetical protein